ncbi:MAG: molybdopterin molybdotransferase MoeA [Acidimicrobiaceae bacterium]|nr:molybdopterin molybdotransferase MoeA [Acidimicrobiaceae bacterium]
MIELSQALKVVLDTISPLPISKTPLNDCDGLVTATWICASESIPPFDNTAVDGFALNYDSVEAGNAEFEIIGTIAAGDAGDIPISDLMTVRIMTGAPMPPGADCVLMVEDSIVTEKNGKSFLSFAKKITRYENVRKAGSDITKDQFLFPPGTQLFAGHLGVLASLGIHEVEVFPRARVGIISTGNELTNDSGPLQPGQIRDSNRPTLMSLVREMGAVPVDLGTIKDDTEILRKGFLNAATSCDAVLSSGGVSVGDFDYTTQVLDELSNGTMSWMQIAIKPAKPFAFGHIGSTPIFGLPGNPVSSAVSFELLARPAINKMMGRQQLFRTPISAVAKTDIRRHFDGKIHFMRVTAMLEADGKVYIEPQSGQSSHLLYSMAKSNALAIVPDGDGLKAGDQVDTLILRML